MMLLLGAWVLVSLAFVLGWGMRSAMVADRAPRKARRASSRVTRFGLLGLFTTLAGKLMLGGVAFAAVGGLAIEGSLPRPMQNAVSAAAERVGLEIPSSDDANDPRLTSLSASEESPAVRRRVLEVVDNWEGEKNCEYLRALAHAAGAVHPARCPIEGGERARVVSKTESASSDVVIPEPATAAQPTPPPAEPPPEEPPPADLLPEEPPPADPPSEGPPLTDPPPDDLPFVDPPAADPPPTDPPAAGPPPTDPPPQ